MAVIALTQEMGSLAKDVAEGLAQEMGLRTLRHEVVEHLSQRMHVSKSLINRLREGQAGMLEKWRADREGFAVYSAEEVLEVAAQGDVVLRGWGATRILRPVPHVVCVRITRAFESRVRWVMENLQTDEYEAAADEVRRSDQAHAARMHETYGVTWGDALLYDMVLNTDRLSVAACVAQIRALCAMPEFAETPASQAVLADMLLQAHVRAALRSDEQTREVKITLAGDGPGRVVLRGIVANDAERQRTEQVAAGVPGVVGVVNELRLMSRTSIFPGRTH